MTQLETNHARLAEPADIAVLGALMIEFYSEAHFLLPRVAAEGAFAALLAAPDVGRVWLLEADARPAGFVVLTVSFSMEYGGLRGFVDDFFVAKPFRRRGLGRLALRVVKEECARLGVRALLVETDSANRDALSVYHRAGFVDTEHRLLKVELGRPVHAAGQGDEADEA